MQMLQSEPNLDQFKRLMKDSGVTQLYFKRLAENDNSKNQVYLGPDFSALNILPTGNFVSDPEKPTRLKAPLHFSWLTREGVVVRAPKAQLILYPQYPEVRFSGFLQGCAGGPNSLMTVRQSGRVLFFGITTGGQIIGSVAAHDSALANEIEALGLQPDIGVFSQISLIKVVRDGDERRILLAELSRIAKLGWIDSKRLNSRGEILLYNARNGGGYTLEAELGVRPNGFSEPDFHGWEIKQHAVRQLTRPASGGPITLMTPEPTGGVYVEDGIQEFIRRFGYADRTIIDRRNFGGVHTAVKICAATSLSLTLGGYDAAKHKITDLSKGISLLDKNGEAAAMWDYRGLLSHWTRKHARAAYIPSLVRTMLKTNQYQYGGLVRLAIGTDFLLFVNAIATGAVYYDPGIKIENASSAKPVIKKRSQFRIRSANIPVLYTKVEEVDVTAHRR